MLNSKKVTLLATLSIGLASVILFSFYRHQNPEIKEKNYIVLADRAKKTERLIDPSPAPQELSDKHVNENSSSGVIAQSSMRMRRPVEESLISGDGLLISNSDKYLENSERFDKILESIRDEYHADAEANEISRIYGRQLASAFSSYGNDISLRKFACGLSVCAASFDGKVVAKYEFLDKLMGSGDEGGAKIYSSNIRIDTLAGQSKTTYRVFFSVDPVTNRIVVKP